MNKFLCLILFVLISLSSCKKILDELNLPPYEFTILLSREASGAKLTWNDSDDPDGDKLDYSVELEGKILISGLKMKTYDITGLQSDKIYRGRVIATDPGGKSISIPFEISLFQEQMIIYNFHPGIFQSLDMNGKPAWQDWDWDCVGIPVVNKDTIFFPESSAIYAIRLADKKVVWKRDLVPRPGRHPILHQGILYVEGYGKLYALNSIDGSTIWSLNYISRRDMAIGNDALYLLDAVDSYTIELKMINLKTGIVQWKIKAPLTGNSTLLVKNGMIFMCVAFGLDKLGYLQAYDAATGVERWRYEFTGESLSVEDSGSPVLFGDLVYIPVAQGYSLNNAYFIHAINWKNGKMAWTKILNDVYEQAHEMNIDATGIYINNEKKISKLNLANGNVIWSKFGNFSKEATLSDAYLFMMQSGQVAALKLETGEIKEIKIGWTGNVPVVVKDRKVFYPALSPMVTNN